MTGLSFDRKKRYMKKLPVQMIALLALMAGFASPAMAQADAILGVWAPTHIDGQPAPPEAQAMHMHFQQNSVLTIRVNAQPGQAPITFNGTYRISGNSLTITMPAELGGKSETVTFTVDNATLTMTGTDEQGTEHSMVMRRLPA